MDATQEPDAKSPAPPARARWGWSTDRIVSLSAMMVGVCTLFITLYQTHLTRQAQSASVLPYLAFGVTSTDAGASITLRNDGVGPARVDAFRIHYQGRIHDVDPYDFYVGLKPEGAQLSVDRMTPGRLLPANTTIQMLGTGGGPDRVRILAEMLKVFALADVPPAWLVSLGAAGMGKAVLEVDYSSVYGDRWRLRSDQLVPQPL